MAMPQSTRMGAGARVHATRLEVGENVSIGEGAVVAGDHVVLGDGVVIGAGADLRASELRLGAHSEIGRNVRVLVADRFAVGRAARISRGVEITCRRFEAGDLLFLGHELAVGYGGTLESTATVTMGHRVALGPRSILNANASIVLDDQVGSGCNLTVWTHGFHFGHSPLDGFDPVFAPVHIRRNVWLGFQVTVLPGVSIGENTIVAAGSVVTRDLPANHLAAGVPARAKQPLQALPRQPDEAIRYLQGALDQWARELEWKGWGVEAPGPGTDGPWRASASAPDDGGRTRVLLLDAHGTAPSVPEPGPAIYLTLAGSPALEGTLPPDATLFDLGGGRFVGPSTVLAEDLRDHLRRHALPCGSDRPFQSIQPVAFARLQAMA